MHSVRFVPLVLCVALACGSTARAPARVSVIDDFGDTIGIGMAPARIVSLNPATTDLVFAVGAGGRLVGRTRWDTYPDSARFVPDLGDGMRPNVEAILAAKPDLVLLYAGRDNLPARDALHRAGITTLSQRIDRVDEFSSGVILLGRVLGDSARAVVVRDSVLASLAHAHSLTADLPRPRVLWPLWESPLLVVGRGSFLDELLAAAGATNLFEDFPSPSPQVTFEEVLRRKPDVVLTTPDGAASIARDPRWRNVTAVRDGHVLVYDTLIVSRPSIRLGEAAMHLAHLLHPELGARR